MPPVMPKEWNTGSTLNSVSCGPKSMRAPACAQFDRMLWWVRTTPFGAPSEPEVNRIAAGSSAETFSRWRPADRNALTLSQVPMPARTSSSQMILTIFSSSSATAVSRARSTKAREASTVLTSAALQAERMLAMPAV